MAINKKKSPIGKNKKGKEETPKKVPASAALTPAGGSNKKKSVKELTKTGKKSPLKNGSAPQNGTALRKDGSKKKRPRRSNKKTEDGEPTPEMLAKREENKNNAFKYLDTWENDRSEWRFNKKIQHWVISNIFKENLVPDSSFDIALKYLAGAVGNARDRLSEFSLQTIKKLEALDELSEEDQVKLDRAQRIVKLSVNETKAKKQEKTPTKAKGKPPKNKTPGKTPQKVAQAATPKSAKKTPKK